jgi:heptosyltransferase-2
MRKAVSLNKPERILIIQTAFIGDVILATAMIERIRQKISNSAQIDFLVRAGNESLVQNHPHIQQVHIWHKKKNKWKNLIALILKIRREKYDIVFNIQRFFSSGLLTVFSKAPSKIGFEPNPLSFLFTQKYSHGLPIKENGEFLHEVQRNDRLLKSFIPDYQLPKAQDLNPSIYFSNEQLNDFKEKTSKYIVMAPFTVWKTKMWPEEYWKELIQKISHQYAVFIIGSPDDKELANSLVPKNSTFPVANLCGKTSLLDSALLIKNAQRVFANDSAPTHMASCFNTPITSIFCSTISDFGFYPLSKNSTTLEIDQLDCRPCGVHGKKECPLEHFKCGRDISVEKVLSTL